MKNFFILLLFLGGYAGWFFYHQKTQLQEGLESAQHQYVQLEQSVSNRRSEYQAAGKVVALKKRVAEQKATLLGQQKHLKSLQQARNDLMKERLNTLATLRQQFVGKTMPFVLASGRDLGSVRIMTMNEAGLSVATTSGIVKVLPSELTPAMREQFFYAP